MDRSRKNGRGGRRPPRDREEERLPSGQRVRHLRNGSTGEIVDSACQYAHPNAEPVFNYLIRGEDGQVSALTEHALGDRGEVELLDEAYARIARSNRRA